jgi:hypothetical protein
VLLVLLELLHFRGADTELLAEFRAELRKTDGRFLVLSSNVFPGFPSAILEDRRMASRFPSLVFLPAIVDAGGDVDSALESYLRDSVSEDLLSHAPTVVFVPNGSASTQSLPDDFDILAWFRRDPAFEAAWSPYRLSGQIKSFDVYRREAEEPIEPES